MVNSTLGTNVTYIRRKITIQNLEYNGWAEGQNVGRAEIWVRSKMSEGRTVEKNKGGKDGKVGKVER